MGTPALKKDRTTEDVADALSGDDAAGVGSDGTEGAWVARRDHR